MKKTILILLSLMLILSSLSLNAKDMKIARDKTLLKDGPGNFYDTIMVLKIGTTVRSIRNSSEDPGWIQILYGKKKGFISKMALKPGKSKSDMFADLDMSGMDIGTKKQIAPGSYTAAIKGFALDYSQKKGYKANNIDDLWDITLYKTKDYFKVRKETDLTHKPKDGELIGVKEAFINDRMNAIGLSISMGVLEQGVIMDRDMTKRMNVIANILNRQTCDYDVRYRVWIIDDSEPVAFSGPGGFIFMSDTLLKMLDDYREIVAIIGHEIGHIALRHGVKDLAIAQARYSAEAAFDELDQEFDDETLKLSDELEEVVEQAVEACALVRDDKEEFEADDVAVEILERYKLNRKYLINTLKKVYLALGNRYPRYKAQMEVRMQRLKKKK